jgi:hypothetical protein
MIILIAIPLSFFILYILLRETGKLIIALLGLAVILIGIMIAVALVGVLWQLAVLVFPYVLGAGAIVLVALILAKSLRSANAPPLLGGLTVVASVVGVVVVLGLGMRSCARAVSDHSQTVSTASNTHDDRSGNTSTSKSVANSYTPSTRTNSGISPPPIPKPELSLAMLAARPQLWPREVNLSRNLLSTNSYGVVELPRGMVMKLLLVDASGLVVTWNSETNRIPLEATDLATRVNF